MKRPLRGEPDRINQLLSHSGCRLLTLLGPGGIANAYYQNLDKVNGLRLGLPGKNP
jgi:hypothetical protein